MFVKQIDLQEALRLAANQGEVEDAEYCYQRITRVRPVEHHYEESGETPYIKYSCPVCEALGNIHQVTLGDKNCPSCGVNLYWGN